MILDVIPTKIQNWNKEVNADGILASSDLLNISKGGVDFNIRSIIIVSYLIH